MIVSITTKVLFRVSFRDVILQLQTALEAVNSGKIQSYF